MVGGGGVGQRFGEVKRGCFLAHHTHTWHGRSWSFPVFSHLPLLPSPTAARGFTGPVKICCNAANCMVENTIQVAVLYVCNPNLGGPRSQEKAGGAWFLVHGVCTLPVWTSLPVFSWLPDANMFVSISKSLQLESL